MTDQVLDLRGLKCPLPVLRAKKAMRSLSPGDTLTLECTDPLTVIDVPHYANESGNKLAAQEQRGEIYIFKLIKQA